MFDTATATATTVTLDRERTLDVRPHLIELERTTGAAVGRLVARVIAGEYHVTDLTETVRLGLIGGGTNPAEAATLARVYVAERPLAEGHAHATQALLAAWNGTTRNAVEIASEPVSPEMLADGGEVILSAPGATPMRVENDGSLTPVREVPGGRYVPLEPAP